MDWRRCLADTAAAADELRARSHVDHVLVFGARLGGSIALASAEQARVAGIVVWDPVLDGGAYVAQLDAMQSALCLDGQRFMVPRNATDAAAQWLGFAISDHFRRQITDMHIERPAVPTLLLDSLALGAPHPWGSLVTDAAAVRCMQPATPWDDPRRLEVAILSHPLIEAVTRHVREAA
jgi:pimeloyl-ACP methyl ester carboxylesterase